jgi:hypothetical protein
VADGLTGGQKQVNINLKCCTLKPLTIISAALMEVVAILKPYMP